MVDETTTNQPSTTTTTAPTTTTEPPPVALGRPGQPFVPVPEAPTPRAVQTPSGLILPVVDIDGDHLQVMTACENLELVDPADVTPIGRAHLVIDPGHGGTEVGAVGTAGAVEKELNLTVALEAARLLEAQGAEVVLTRTTDVNLTTRFRGNLAAAIEPALFVSIHHNGGAPRSGDQVGSIVFTKTRSPEATRFGGLFFDRISSEAGRWAEPQRGAFATYWANLNDYRAQVYAYDQSVIARDNALFANGQIPGTTLPEAEPEPVDGVYLPAVRNPVPTTTAPPVAEGAVPVPDTLPVPAPFVEPPVREFLFAGSGNAGVRSWVRPDGEDYLSVLRNSGDVPAVLAEFLYVTNPSEEELLLNADYLAAQGAVLADAIVEFFVGSDNGSGFVDDQYDDQPIGGGGKPSDCVEPDYGWE